MALTSPTEVLALSHFALDGTLKYSVVPGLMALIKSLPTVSTSLISIIFYYLFTYNLEVKEKLPIFACESMKYEVLANGVGSSSSVLVYFFNYLLTGAKVEHLGILSKHLG